MSITLDESQNRVVNNILYMIKHKENSTTFIHTGNSLKDFLQQNKKNNFIIEGGPGTGKSLLALKLYSELTKYDQKVLLLSFNKPLNMYFKQQFTEDDNKYILTYESFKLKKRHFNTIIVDEAQDFNEKEIYRIACHGDRLICFIDPAQVTQSDKISIDDLKRILDCETTYSLEKNYRNPQNIINFSKYFWNGEGLFPQKSLIGEGNMPVLISEFEEIKTIIKSNPDKTIGIVLEKKEIDKYETNLEDFFPQVYRVGYDTTKHINFDEKGVFIFQYSVIKGLEFDIIIMINPASIKNNNDRKKQEKIQNQIYVAATRAKEKLYIFQNSQNLNSNTLQLLLNFFKDKI